MKSKTLRGIVKLWLLLSQLQVSRCMLAPLSPKSKQCSTITQQQLTNVLNRKECQPSFQRLCVILGQSVYDEVNEVPATTIEEGTNLIADTFMSTNPVVVNGKIEILQHLECETNLHIRNSGYIQGDIIATDGVVTVDGKLQGGAKCLQLIVGPTGEVTGDVHCSDIIIRPGGKIGGNLSCEEMKSERDVFRQVRYPLQEEAILSKPCPSYQAVMKDRACLNLPDTNTNEASQALVAATPPSQAVPEVIHVNTDIVGNPLIGAATEDQVESYRKNREKIFATRNFLDKYIVPGSNKPLLVNKNARKPKEERTYSKNSSSRSHRPDDSYSLKQRRSLDRTREVSPVVLAARGEPRLPSPGKTRSTTRIFATKEKRETYTNSDSLSENRRRYKFLRSTKENGGASSSTSNNDVLPTFLQTQTDSTNSATAAQCKSLATLSCFTGSIRSFFSYLFYKILVRRIFFWRKEGDDCIDF